MVCHLPLCTGTGCRGSSRGCTRESASSRDGVIGTRSLDTEKSGLRAGRGNSISKGLWVKKIRKKALVWGPHSSTGLESLIAVGSMAASGSHGVGAVAETIYLTHKQKSERASEQESKLTGNSIDF